MSPYHVQIDLLYFYIMKGSLLQGKQIIHYHFIYKNIKSAEVHFSITLVFTKSLSQLNSPIVHLISSVFINNFPSNERYPCEFDNHISLIISRNSEKE